MKEFSVEARNAVPETSNTTDLLVDRVEATPSTPLFARPSSSGQWDPVTALEFSEQVKGIAKGLIAQGIQAGDRIGLMARTSYEWTLLDFAIWYAGAVSVPVYETSSPSQVAWILSDSGAIGIVVETPQHENVVRQAATEENLPLRHIWQIEGAGLEDLEASGHEISEETLEEHRTQAQLSDLATIIYTSGTTGRPKGCELTHSNFVLLSRAAKESLKETLIPGTSTIIFLPLAHVFARYISVLCVDANVQAAHTPDVKNLLGDLQSFKPSFLLVVPRVFEKVYNSALGKAEAAGKGKIFRAAATTAVEYSRAKEAGKVPLLLKAKFRLFDALVYSKLRTAMGGNVRFAVSGGGPLGERLGYFFSSVGVQVLEGYGLTETTAPITVNTPSKTKIGTVGRPLPGNGIRIAEDGEILAKGICVMRGYYHNPEKTDESFTEDGWFHTGDIGELDEDGFLRITGRKKEIIVTASGKNVIPGQLEDIIRSQGLVSQCVVVGDNRPFVAALITLDEEALGPWLERNHLEPMTLQQAAEHDRIREEIQRFVTEANANVSRAESIRAFRIVPKDFTEESGHLTPSMKIKRGKVVEDYAEIIDSIYSAPSPS